MKFHFCVLCTFRHICKIKSNFESVIRDQRCKLSLEFNFHGLNNRYKFESFKELFSKNRNDESYKI